MPDRLSEYMSDRMPDRLPECMSDRVSEYMSDSLSEYLKLHMHVQIFVMAGITGSKVIPNRAR